MLPRRFPRGIRGPRPPQVPQLEYMDYYQAQQTLLPTMMDNRLKPWGQPGSEVNPQPKCMLYDGRIPQEITDLIFEYILSPDAPIVAISPPGNPPHNFDVRNDHKPGDDALHVRNSNAKGDSAHDQARRDSNDQLDIYMPEHTNIQPSRGLLVVRDRQRRGFDWVRPGCNHKPIYSGWTMLQTCRRIYLDAAKFLVRNREVVLFEGRGPTDGYSFADLSRRVRKDHDQPDLQRIPSIHMYSQMYQLVSFPFEYHVLPSDRDADIA